MNEPFAEILAVGGKTNSLGRANEVTDAVLNDQSKFEELYGCLFSEDAWVRMRAADSLEKVCRVHPEWLTQYIDRLLADFSTHTQASIQWHLAQIYRQVILTPDQKQHVITWLRQRLSTTEVDWIVAANIMDTLGKFVQDGSVSEPDFKKLLEIQTGHTSKSVVKRATKWLKVLG